MEAAALADEKVQAFLNGATPKKVIVVAGRLVNIVVA
jgi:leucyl-tRNA synthetase